MTQRLGIRLGIIPRGLPIAGPADTTPDNFPFTDVADAVASTVYHSGPQTLSGTTAATVISVTGSGGVKYSKNGAAYTAAPGMISSGDTFELEIASSAVPGDDVAGTLTIGGVSFTWTVTTTGGGEGQLDFTDPNQSGFIATI